MELWTDAVTISAMCAPIVLQSQTAHGAALVFAARVRIAGANPERSFRSSQTHCGSGPTGHPGRKLALEVCSRTSEHHGAEKLHAKIFPQRFVLDLIQ